MNWIDFSETTQWQVISLVVADTFIHHGSLIRIHYKIFDSAEWWILNDKSTTNRIQAKARSLEFCGAPIRQRDPLSDSIRHPWRSYRKPVSEKDRVKLILLAL